MTALTIALLGQFECLLSDMRPIKFRTSRAQALLAYLTTEHALGNAHHGRETLMELLWPGMPLDSSRSNLRQNLYYLRQSVPPARSPHGNEATPLVLSDRQMISLNTEYPLESDIQRFIKILNGAKDNWIEAVDLYRGEFLADFYLADANPFELWVSKRREAFRRQLLSSLEGLTDLYIAQGKLNDGELYARRQLAIDSLREIAYRQLMEILYRSGRRVEALRLYQECLRILEDELDAPPSEATSELADAIREGTMADQPQTDETGKGTNLQFGNSRKETTITREQKPESSPRAELDSLVRTNLPEYASPFIGRDVELEMLVGFFTDPNIRLITIFGPGGIGKTRLATAAADRVLTTQLFPDGLVFLDLAPIEDSEQILGEIADALHYPLVVPDDPASQQQFLDYLGHKKMLLVLDNFEHLLDSTGLVTDLLQAGPSSKILVTSRERLQLHLEQLYPLGGLASPNSATLENASEHVAVRLFLQSARRNLPTFTLRNEQDLSEVVRICRLTAGMPLALELAGSWVDTLSLGDIADELQQGLDILETELRNIPERQRSMRASIDYTWRRLDKVEQSLFANFSIFQGGATRSAAQAVTGASLRQLSHLVNKSLIRFDEQHARYQVHELLRQFGREKLRQMPELELAAYERHSTYFCRLMGDLTDALKGPGKRQALSTIEADLENIRLAWNQASSQRNHVAIGMAVESLWRFYTDYGRRDIRELEKAVADLSIAEATKEQRIVLGRLLAPLGRFYGDRGDKARAKKILESSLELLRSHEATEETLVPLLFLADVQDSLGESTGLYHEGLALARKNDDPWAIGHALLFLGWNERLGGSYERALQNLREALKQFKKNGDEGGIVVTLQILVFVSIDLGLYEEALARAKEASSIAVGFNPMFRMMGVRSLGQALIALNRHEEAEALIQEGLSISREFGRDNFTEDLEYWLGQIALKKKDYELAAKRFLDSLARASKYNNLELVVHNHNALGRLDLVQNRRLDSRKRFRDALRFALQLEQRPLILDCLANFAALNIEDAEIDDAALLLLQILDDPASSAKLRERAADQLTYISTELSANNMNNIRQLSERSHPIKVAERLLSDLDIS